MATPASATLGARFRGNNPAGYSQMPGGGCLAGVADRKKWYYLNRNGKLAPTSHGPEDTICEIWPAGP